MFRRKAYFHDIEDGQHGHGGGWAHRARKKECCFGLQVLNRGLSSLGAKCYATSVKWEPARRCGLGMSSTE